MASSITTYVRTFANPLLALAFKEGVDYVGDPDFKALEPKKDGDLWEVIIEHEVEDDADDNDDDILHSTVSFTQPHRSPPGSPFANSTSVVERKQLTLKDYEDKFNKIPARPAREIIHPPVKVTAEVEEDGPEPLPPVPPKSNTNNIEGMRKEPIIFDPNSIEPCGECIPCSTGQDCLRVINAACAAYNNER